MNDDLVVQKILKLLENNTAFIGYALNGGIGTKINVRNTETGKTIQALSINVDSSGEVLVVKDSDDGKYKAVTFKAAQQTTERIIQIRKTKPIDDKKIIEYTDSDVEVFYLFVKLIDTGSPYPTELQSTWIRKGNSCTQFVGAYERCNYSSRDTIGGITYTGLPYVEHPSLQECLNDDLGRDARTPHGSGNSTGGNAAWKYFSTRVTGENEERMLAALTSHDGEYGTNYKKLFGYATILECSGAMNLQGWEVIQVRDSVTNVIIRSFFRCEFSFLPGFTNQCTSAMQAAGYCDSRGFINSKCPLPGQEAPGQPSVGSVQNDWGHTYGWVDLPYDFMYKRHFSQSYLNGSTAPGGFFILEVNEDQVPANLPDGYFSWTPGCPSGGNGGPYNGGGGNRFPDGIPSIRKRDMKLSNHKAEIWLGNSKKQEAIKLYELGVSDLFSGMYNSMIVKADETRVDIFTRTQRENLITPEERIEHEKFYENWNKNIIDQRIDPRMWVYIINNTPRMQFFIEAATDHPYNNSLGLFIHHLYNKTINLTVVDNKTQIVHLKLGLSPANTLSNTDCKGNTSSIPLDYAPTQAWEYQKTVTIKIKNWEISSSNLGLDTTEIDSWNKEYLSYRYLTMFRRAVVQSKGNVLHEYRNRAGLLLLRPNSSTDITELYSGNHFEQFNYSLVDQGSNPGDAFNPWRYNISRLFFDYEIVNNGTPPIGTQAQNQRFVGFSTVSWWEMWDKTIHQKKTKRLNTIVGYETNINEIYTDWGLSQSLTYPTVNPVLFKYFEYIPQENRIVVPSLINRIRSKTISNNVLTTSYPHLRDRSNTLLIGENFFFSNGEYRWSDAYPVLLNGDVLPSPPFDPKRQLLTTQSRGTYTREVEPISLRNGSGTLYELPGDRMNTDSWKNKLWAQILYTGETKVDVDSYRNVEFNLPTNPSQYIKFTTNSTHRNSEFNFVDSGQQQPKVMLETVLTPGVLDVTKQVPIKKPTNVELDPNYSFLVYIYPFCTVTKKTKEI